MMPKKNQDFTPEEIDVIRYIFGEIYSLLEYNGNRDRFENKGEADIELTQEDYSNYQSVLEKLGVAIY
jgi:hypothetical protein